MTMAQATNGHATNFATEKKIRLKSVAGLPCFEERPSYHKVWNWVRYGFRGVKLEKKREGNFIMTSREAVERFLKAIQ
jgi:hypothetical protein